MYAHLTRHMVLVLTPITKGILDADEDGQNKYFIDLKCAILWESEASHTQDNLHYQAQTGS